jgi:hypothetical protein
VTLAQIPGMTKDRSPHRPSGEERLASSTFRVCRRLPTATSGALTLTILAGAALVAGCQRPITSTVAGPPSPSQLAQLWVEPKGARDLYWGIGGKSLAPNPDTPFKVIEIKRDGFSRGYTVVDGRGREWSAKFPPEAPTEVAASRIHWGVGYHQPPIYYLSKWTAEKAESPNPQLPARFRQKNPTVNGRELKDEGSWSYYENPFVGSRELKGLLVLQAMLGNSDLKDDNNARYVLREALEGARVWYVARDLGHTFGRTGVVDAPRGDPEVFDKTPFITGVVNGRVKFDWRGRHDNLFDDITPADVRWICGRLRALTDRQWRDAFRAGGMVESDADRFIRRLKQKIAEGMALQG